MAHQSVAPAESYALLAADFERDGYLHLRGIIAPAELDTLRRDSGAIVDGGWRGVEPESDCFHDVLPDTGEDVFHRVQYVFPKARENSFLVLLAQPFLLGLIEHLVGADFLCGAEALVFKLPGNGRDVPVHTDGDVTDSRLGPLIFNVDYYLDDSSLENGCLWIAPGSHQSPEMASRAGELGFDYPGLIPLPAGAGDVVIHNVHTVHGSRRSRGGALRRVLYYEFQSLGQIAAQGGVRPGHPVPDTWTRDRIRLLMRAIDLRATRDFAAAETPYAYRAPASNPITWPGRDEAVNLRPALGYNKYF